MSGAVLDTGSLIALERGDRAMDVLLSRVVKALATLTVPAGCVAQAWRHPRRQARLARLLRRPFVEVVALDDDDARRVGLLLAASGTADVVDAHVAVCAVRRAVPVLTSDPDDLARLVPTLRLRRV
ncbi:MAG: PIN domain-containing protein [bacterium]|nr:PIN domain-containing protein [bacterium]